jgi:hypothetical protein
MSSSVSINRHTRSLSATADFSYRELIPLHTRYVPSHQSGIGVSCIVLDPATSSVVCDRAIAEPLPIYRVYLTIYSEHDWKVKTKSV